MRHASDLIEMADLERKRLREEPELRDMHCSHPNQDWCDCDWCRYVLAISPVLAFVSAPMPTCACGMFRAGMTFENWSPRCSAHPDGGHDPRPSYPALI